MIRAVVASAAVTAATLFLSASPANAAAPDEYLLVSPDGLTFTSSSDFGLFDDAGLVVPGDHVMDDVWIKNNTAHVGRVRIDLTDPSSNNKDFAAAVSIAVDPGSGAVNLADAMNKGRCTVLSSDLVLQPGEKLHLSAAVHVDRDLGSTAQAQGDEGQNGSIGFQLRGILMDAAVPATALPGDVCDVVPESIPTTAGQNLPATGASVDGSAVAIAAGAIVGGAVLALVARRRKEQQND